MKFSVEIILIIIIGIIILYQYCSETEHFDTISNTNIDNINKLNKVAEQLLKADGVIPNKLSLTGSNMTGVDIKEPLLKLRRAGTGGVQNNVSADINIGADSKAIDGTSVINFKLASYPGDGNTWGSTPDTTIMSMSSNGVSIGQDYLPPKGTDDKLYVKGNTMISGKTRIGTSATIGGDISDHAILNIRNADGRYTHFGVTERVGDKIQNGSLFRGNVRMDNDLDVLGNITAANFIKTKHPDNPNLGNASMTNTNMYSIQLIGIPFLAEGSAMKSLGIGTNFAGKLVIQYGEATTSYDNWTVIKFPIPYTAIISYEARDKATNQVLTRYDHVNNTEMFVDSWVAGHTKNPLKWFTLGYVL